MCYVGQSNDAKRRFKAHLLAKDSVCLHDAIREFGNCAFRLDILERQIEDYNDREKYWIKKLNTLFPNGYNMTSGGEGYPHFNGSNCYQAKLSETDVSEIQYLLKTTNETQEDIAKRFDVTQTIVSNINIGYTYRDELLQYPIRKTDKTIVLLIKSLLINTSLSLQKIADKADVGKSTVNAINQGRIYQDAADTYPLRKEKNVSKLSDVSVLNNIHDDLKYGKLSTQKIAEKYEVRRESIEAINQGRSHHRDDWKYPIRAFPAFSVCLPDSVIDSVIHDLKCTKKSFRSIARKHNVSNHSIISGINNGTIKSYLRDEEYPIRARY